jgi:hypothetical protein
MSIAVVLQLVRPAGTDWRLLGDDWLTGMNESGRRVQWPAARATPKHAGDILREQERSNPANVALRTASPSPNTRLLGPGGSDRSRLALSWLGRIQKMDFLIGAVLGFVLGYGGLEAVSRDLRVRARREKEMMSHEFSINGATVGKRPPPSAMFRRGPGRKAHC